MLLTTLFCFASITEMLSLLPLLTYTKLSVATMEFGLEPPTAEIPSTISPTNTPVLTLDTTSGFSLLTSTPHTEKDSGALGSPRPANSSESFSIPSFISLEPYAEVGNFEAVSFNFFLSNDLM